MHREYNDKISYIKECIQKKNKLTILLRQTEQDLIREKLLLNSISNTLQNKNKNVLKLETTNITSLFYTILGNKEEQTQKEKQELLKNRLKYEQYKHNVDYLVKESKNLVDQLAKIKVCETEYEDLINKKLKDICIDDEETSQELRKLIKRKESIKVNIKEIDEAINAGENVLQYVKKTIVELEKEENWGLSAISQDEISIDNHCHIDNARFFAEEIQRMLDKFKREISDINMVTGKEIAVGVFETFADYFFDALIFDWLVQSEVCKSLDIVKNTKNQVDKAMSKLYEEKVTEEFLMHQLEQQINIMIEKA